MRAWSNGSEYSLPAGLFGLGVAYSGAAVAAAGRAAPAIDSATMQERLRHGRWPGQAPKPTRISPEMSRTETEIMRLAVEGMTNREIAAKVHLSQNTVKFHMRQIFQKTGAVNRTGLAHEAAKQGWL